MFKKDYYFRITICSDLMCNKDIKGQKFVCVGVEFQASIENRFFDINMYTLKISVGRVWIVIRYFLFEEQAFNGLLKVIVIQNIFPLTNNL